MKPYLKYKDSGVEWIGEVPEHWEVKRLKFTAIINPGKSELAKLPETFEVSFYPMETIGFGNLKQGQRKTLKSVGSYRKDYVKREYTLTYINSCNDLGGDIVTLRYFNHTCPAGR